MITETAIGTLRMATKLASGVNKEDGSLLHSADVPRANAPINKALVEHARGCTEVGVKFVPIAPDGGAPTLGPGCKGGARDGYGCAHHLILEEGAHVRP